MKAVSRAKEAIGVGEQPSDNPDAAASANLLTTEPLDSSLVQSDPIPPKSRAPRVKKTPSRGTRQSKRAATKTVDFIEPPVESPEIKAADASLPSSEPITEAQEIQETAEPSVQAADEAKITTIDEEKPTNTAVDASNDLLEDQNQDHSDQGSLEAKTPTVKKTPARANQRQSKRVTITVIEPPVESPSVKANDSTSDQTVATNGEKSQDTPVKKSIEKNKPETIKTKTPKVQKTPARVSTNPRPSRRTLASAKKEQIVSIEPTVEPPIVAAPDVPILSTDSTVDQHEVSEEMAKPAEPFNDSVVATEDNEKTSISRVETTTTLEALVGAGKRGVEPE